MGEIKSFLSKNKSAIIYSLVLAIFLFLLKWMQYKFLVLTTR